MKIITLRHSLSLDYTPQQWVGLCNTSLLLLMTFMLGLVIFNMNSLDQRLISVLDSSVVAIDLITTDFLHLQTTSYWRTISEDISVYSAFYQDTQESGRNSVVLVGSSPQDNLNIEDLRCLIKYDHEDDINIAFVEHQKLSNCSDTMFLFCDAKFGTVPKKVALVSYSNSSPKQWIDVKVLHPGLDNPPKIAACVYPFSGQESVLEIAEFVAFYEAIGISHFYFYTQNSGNSVVDFILQLKGMGHSINLLPWNRDLVASECSISLLEHVQDCSLMAVDKYSYVLTVDVSDFVVPSQYFRLPELVEDLNLGDNFSQLRLSYASFCEAPASLLRNSDQLAIQRRTLRGAMQVSNSNYILRLRPLVSHEFSVTDHLANRNQMIERLPADEVMVHRHSENCGFRGMLDLSAYKYMNLVKQSNVLQIYKRISKNIWNKTSPGGT